MFLLRGEENLVFCFTSNSTEFSITVLHHRNFKIFMAVFVMNSATCVDSVNGHRFLNCPDGFICKICRRSSEFLSERRIRRRVVLQRGIHAVSILKISVFVDSIRKNKSVAAKCMVSTEKHKEDSTACPKNLINYLPVDSEIRNFDSSDARFNRKSAVFLEEMDEEVLSKRLLELSRTNKVRSASELYHSMELSGLSPNPHACNSYLSCLVRNELVVDAIRVFKSMEVKELTSSHSYSLILKAVGDTQGCESSLAMFFQLEGKYHKVFDAIVYNTMISILGKEDNWVACEKLWLKMKENGYQGSHVTYSLLVTIFVRCSQYELAINAYNEMIQNEMKPGNDVSYAIIKACMKEGNWDLALSVFECILKDGQNPNLISCNALINSLGKAGEVEVAFKVYNMITSFGHTPDSYTMNALLCALYRSDRAAEALHLFNMLLKQEGFQRNLHLYNTALMCCTKLRSWGKALQILWQMEDSGLSIPSSSYNLVISSCEVARRPKVALQVFEHMIHQKCSPDTFTYLSLLRSCIWGSLWDKVDEILKIAPDVSVYNAAVQGMCLRGKLDAARSLYKKMGEKGFKPDGKTRAMMLQNLQQHSTFIKGRKGNKLSCI